MFKAIATKKKLFFLLPLGQYSAIARNCHTVRNRIVKFPFSFSLRFLTSLFYWQNIIRNHQLKAPLLAQRYRTCLSMRETWKAQVPSLGWEDTLEEGMAPTPIFLPGDPWTEEPGRLQSIGSQRFRQDWSDLTCTYASSAKGSW